MNVRFSYVLAKRIKTLLIPYFCWCSIWFGYIWTIFVVSQHTGTGACWPFHGWENVRLYGLDPFCFPAMGVLWYIRACIVLILLTPFLNWCLKKLGIGFLILLYGMEIILALMPSYYIGKMFLPLSSLVYFSVGRYLRDLDSSLSCHRVPRGIAILAIIIGMGLCAVKSVLSYVNEGDFAILVHVAVPFLLFGVWCIVPNIRWPEIFVRNTFPIYLIQVFGIATWGILFGHHSVRISSVLLQFLAVMAFSLGVTWFMRKTFPRFALVLFGGR